MFSTGLRGGVHLKIPLVSQQKEFSPILEKLRLQKRGVGGVDTEAVGGIFDISNSDRLGSSEVEQLQRVVDGVKLLIAMEKCLEAGKPIKSLYDKLMSGQAAREIADAAEGSTGTVESNFPDLSQHNSWMSRCLTKEIYDRLSSRKTPSGFTLDKAIQTGVDNPGHPYIMTVGCVAGDEVKMFSNSLSGISMECCKTKTRLIILANHTNGNSAMSQSEFAENSWFCAKRGKMRASESLLIFVFIG